MSFEKQIEFFLLNLPFEMAASKKDVSKKVAQELYEIAVIKNQLRVFRTTVFKLKDRDEYFDFYINKYSLLNLLIKAGAFDYVEVLIDAYPTIVDAADMNACSDRDSPLFLAIKAKNLDLVKKILKKNPTLVGNECGTVVIETAIKSDSVKDFDIFISVWKYASDKLKIDKERLSILAFENGAFKNLDFLSLECDVDLEKIGPILFHKAAEVYDVKYVSEHLSYLRKRQIPGINTLYQGQTALSVIINKLLGLDGMPKKIIESDKKLYYEFMIILITMGASVNISVDYYLDPLDMDAQLETLLDIAVRCEDEELVRFLIRHGAQFTCKTLELNGRWIKKRGIINSYS